MGQRTENEIRQAIRDDAYRYMSGWLLRLSEEGAGKLTFEPWFEQCGYGTDQSVNSDVENGIRLREEALSLLVDQGIIAVPESSADDRRYTVWLSDKGRGALLDRADQSNHTLRDEIADAREAFERDGSTPTQEHRNRMEAVLRRVLGDGFEDIGPFLDVKYLNKY